MDTGAALLILAYAFVVNMGAAWYVALVKRRSVAEGLAFSILLGPFGLLVFVLLPNGEAPPQAVLNLISASYSGLVTPIDLVPPPPPPPPIPIPDPPKISEPRPKPVYHTHRFTVVLKGAAEETSDLEVRLARVGCSDARRRVRGDRVYLEYSREGLSFDETTNQVVSDLRKSGLDVEQVLPTSDVPRSSAHQFTVYLKGVTELTTELENRLYEAGCADALVGASAGVVSVDFSREGESLKEAAKTAVRNIRDAGYEVERVVSSTSSSV